MMNKSGSYYNFNNMCYSCSLVNFILFLIVYYPIRSFTDYSRVELYIKMTFICMACACAL
ncbi:hypothetical protein T492DRAFT_911927 [Pavlovales sp. CCMP2436]|nr:hypothetical protein T492DRAFT_911927 [Pavlovales sp. CCMP2436]